MNLNHYNANKKSAPKRLFRHIIHCACHLTDMVFLLATPGLLKRTPALNHRLTHKLIIVDSWLIEFTNLDQSRCQLRIRLR